MGAPFHLGGGLVGGVNLVVVEAAAAETPDLVVAHVLDHLAKPRVGTEEVLAHIRTGFGLVPLVFAVHRRVHLVDQDSVDIRRQQWIPVGSPQDLDDVPSGTAEGGLEFLNDLAVAAHRPVQPLQVAVDHPGQIVELLAGGQVDGTESLRLVGLAVTDERPARGIPPHRRCDG